MLTLGCCSRVDARRRCMGFSSLFTELGTKVLSQASSIILALERYYTEGSRIPSKEMSCRAPL